MYNLTVFDEYYKMYIKSLYHWIPEGIYTVDLSLLQKLDLLHFDRLRSNMTTSTRHFQIAESADKITLINNDFVVWMMSDRIDLTPVTYTLIAFNKEGLPKLEIAFVASGVYNHSRIILRVLERFLKEIQDTEDLLQDFEKAS